MEQLALQYPTWFILLCIAAGVLYAGGLYYRATTFKYASERTKRWLGGLSVLRFLVVTILSFLLLSPFIRTRSTEAEEPIIVVVEDESLSVRYQQTKEDSSQRSQALAQAVATLEEQYQVDRYRFGASLSEGGASQYTAKTTDIGAAFSGLYDRYVNQNVGAVVLVSDGVYNQGNNPLYAATQLDAPIYSIALGDTVQPKDLQLTRVQHNSIAYLGDKLEVRLGINAYNVAGAASRLTIQHITPEGNRIIHQEPLTFDKDDVFVKSSVLIEMNNTGVQQYLIQLNPIEGEASTLNNTQRFFVEVLDSRQQLLILAHAPHPDVTAIKSALEGNRNYEVTLAYTKDGIANPKAYDLAILHQLPVKANTDLALIEQLQQANVPLWFILGSQTDLAAFNRAQSVVAISNFNGTINEVQAALQNRFSLFKVPDGLAQALKRYPPLQAPFGKFGAAADAVNMLTQQIGAVQTDYPLLTFQQSIDQRTAVLLGSGIWRWRLYHYLQYNNHELIDDWLRKMVQFLAVKTDKRAFRVSLPKNIFNENEPVVLEAELYNAAYELVNDPDVQVNVTNEESEVFPFTFNRSGEAYSLDAGFLPVGSYTYSASTTFNGEAYEANGQFSVRPVNLEARQTTANHQLLYQLAQQSGGALLHPDAISQLPSQITTRDDVRPILHDSYTTQAIINLKWIFFLVVLLAGLEWFIRRFNGAY